MISIEFGTLFTRGDDNYDTVSINFNFNYFSNDFTQLTIDTNGRVKFNSNFDSIPDSDNYFISGINYDLDTRTSGGIYYQNLIAQSSDFNSTVDDLNLFNALFVPTNLTIFRITYDNVPTYGSSLNNASFQIILASHLYSSKSFVVLKYTTCPANGFALNFSPGLYYLLLNGQRAFIPISNSSCSNSNVNKTGTWVFDVSSVYGKLN